MQREPAVSRAAPYAVEVCEHVLVAVHRSGPPLPMVREIERALAALIAKHGTVGVLAILQAGVNPPDGDVRAAICDGFQTSGKALRGVALVMEGTAPWAGPVRSFATFLSVAQPEAGLVKMHRTVGEGAEWLAKKLGAAIGGRGLTAARLQSTVSALVKTS